MRGKVYPSKKKAFIEKIVNEADKETVQKKAVDLLVKDSETCKLYKYAGDLKDTESGTNYIIESILNNTLSCVAPCKFNDPFDCTVGVSFQALFEAKFSQELEEIKKTAKRVIRVAKMIKKRSIVII